MRLVGVPPQQNATDPQVAAGEQIFKTTGCSDCHVTDVVTGANHPFSELRNQAIRPFTDLLLHDMGPDLTDNSVGEYSATPTMWRTPPLWSIGLCNDVAAGYTADVTLNPAPNQAPCHYLHDGRAASLLEAVLWHGGEATNVKNQVLALSADDRNALVAFLGSL